MLTARDLRLYPQDKSTSKIVRACSASTLVKLAKIWFDTRELQPANKESRYEDYVGLTTKQVHLKLQADWTSGFRAIQIAQMQLQTVVHDASPKKKWRVFRVLKEGKGSLNLNIDTAVFQETIERFLSQAYDCYFYAMHDKKTDLFWIRIQIMSEMYGFKAFPSPKIAYMMYCPHTEFVLFTGTSLPINLDHYVREAILLAFHGDKLLMQDIRGQAASHLAHVVKTRNARGVFSELRIDLNYANPLSIRQKSKFVDDEDKGEPSRRIKALNHDEIMARVKSVKENFGFSEMYGSTELSLQVTMPMKQQDVDFQTSHDLPSVAFDLTLKGEIANGLRNMISHGQIKTPIPEWLETMGSSNITQLFITENGASDHKQDDESEEKNDDENDEDDESDEDHLDANEGDQSISGSHEGLDSFHSPMNLD